MSRRAEIVHFKICNWKRLSLRKERDIRHLPHSLHRVSQQQQRQIKRCKIKDELVIKQLGDKRGVLCN